MKCEYPVVKWEGGITIKFETYRYRFLKNTAIRKKCTMRWWKRFRSSHHLNFAPFWICQNFALTIPEHPWNSWAINWCVCCWQDLASTISQKTSALVYAPIMKRGCTWLSIFCITNIEPQHGPKRPWEKDVPVSSLARDKSIWRHIIGPRCRLVTGPIREKRKRPENPSTQVGAGAFVGDMCFFPFEGNKSDHVEYWQMYFVGLSLSKQCKLKRSLNGLV